MATPNIVPRGDNEGGLGTLIKRWAAAFFNALSCAVLTVTSFSASGFVKNSAGGSLSGGNSLAAGDLPSGIDSVKIGAGGVSNTVFGYLAGVSSALQTQLNGKLGGAKIGYFVKNTADNSGTTSVVTGLGFAPRQVILFAVVTATPEVSVGMDDGTLHQCLHNAFPFSAGSWRDSVSFSISLNQTVSDNYSGCITALGADGFTVTWTKYGLPTGTATILWQAVG